MREIKVERHSFFDAPQGGTLQFTEHAPVGKLDDDGHHDCNCTKTVTERPVGTPSQINQEFTIEDAGWSFATRFWTSSVWLTFGKHGSDDHAYFMFNRKERSVRVEITLLGYGLTDCFFAHLYLGNQIDVSCFMNGHSPSRVVDLRKIKSDQLWLHECSWGDEAVRTMPDSDEAAIWRSAFACVEEIDRLADPYRLDQTSTVESLRARLVDDEEVLDRVDTLHMSLSPIVARLRLTELFRLSDEIYQELHPPLPPKEQARVQKYIDSIRGARPKGQSS